MRFRTSLVLCVSWTAVGCVGAVEQGPSATTEPRPSDREPEPTASPTPPEPGPVGDTTGPSGGGAPATATCARPVVQPVLRRLTRAQWKNSVADILGVPGDAGNDLVDDHLQGGFASNVGASVTPLAMEKYVGAAEAVAEKAAARITSLVPCDVAARGAEACGRGLIGTLGPRFFRRPLEPDETSSLEALFDAASRAHGFSAASAAVIQALLLSPHFLYLIEPGHALATGRHAPFAIAGWLAAFLWQGPPDAALYDAAAQGPLASPAMLRAQIDRMLRDPKARRGVSGFFEQWLELDQFDSLDKDAGLFPEFEAVRPAMLAETRQLIDHVVHDGDGRFETLLTADFSFLTGPLQRLYGLPVTAGGSPERLTLTTSHRRGLLTQASFLALHAHPAQTSIVLRGKFIREKLLCQHLPSPPVDVNDVQAPDRSAAELAAERLADKTCGACHRMIDPLGLAFETYDPIGRHRTSVNGTPINPSGQIEFAKEVNGRYADAVDLVARLAASGEVRRCLAMQWTQYALARAEAPAGGCWNERIVEAFGRNSMTIPDLMRAMAETAIASFTTTP